VNLPGRMGAISLRVSDPLTLFTLNSHFSPCFLSSPSSLSSFIDQIQLYAANSQLTHPLCSPVLHGSLGGLPPLYILCGDGEVLRDEILYLAHRAAHPEKYPLNDRLLAASKRTRDDAEAFNHKPTKVHLQVFDDQCHGELSRRFANVL